MLSKYSCLSFLLVFLPFLLISQIPLEIGTKWHYDAFHTFGGQIDIIAEITGDTIIQGKQCFKLQKNLLHCDDRPIVDYLFQDGDQLFYYHFENESFSLLYDFAAKVGDTYAIQTWGFYNNDEGLDYFKVDSTFQTNIENQQVTGQVVLYGSKQDDGTIKYYDDYPITIIEGVGNLRGLFYWNDYGWCDDIHIYELVCYKHPTYGVFVSDDTKECKVTSIDHAQRTQAIITFPNPTDDKWYISTDITISDCMVQIQNSVGNIFFNKKIDLIAGQNVPLGLDVPRGIYFVTFYKNNKKVYAGKMLKI